MNAYRAPTRTILAAMVMTDLIFLAAGSKIETIALLDLGFGVFSLVKVLGKVCKNGKSIVAFDDIPDTSHSDN